MSTRPDVPPEPGLSEIESALGALVPAPGRLNRDRVLFEAGRAAARRPVGRWGWPALAASLALVVLGQGVLLARRPEPRVIERLVVVHQPAAEPGPEPNSAPEAPVKREPVPLEVLARSARPGPTPGAWPFGAYVPIDTRYTQLQKQILRFGLDGLPEPPPLALRPRDAEPVTSGALLRLEIDRILNLGESS